MGVPDDPSCPYCRVSSPRFSLVLSELAEKMPEAPSAVLQDTGASGDFTDADIETFSNFSLRRSLRQFLDQLPTLREGVDLLGRENVRQEIFRLPRVFDGGKQCVELLVMPLRYMHMLMVSPFK